VSETSAYKIQTPGNYPEENIQHKVIAPDRYFELQTNLFLSEFALIWLNYSKFVKKKELLFPFKISILPHLVV
jgi:hypothetical protein